MKNKKIIKQSLSVILICLLNSCINKTEIDLIIHNAKIAIKNDETLKNNKDLDKFLENITIIEKDLVSIFEKNRITKIQTDKKKFDPNIHQAMSEIEDVNMDAGTILQEIQAGYMLGDRLLRPALVSVAKKKVEKVKEKEEKK